MKKEKTNQETRDQELQGNISVNDYQEIKSGYSVYASMQDYFRDQALQNAQDQHEQESMQADILAVKLCKNNNLMFFVKLPNGSKINVFLPLVLANEMLGKDKKGKDYLPLKPIYTTTPKGIQVLKCFEIDLNQEYLNEIFKKHFTKMCVTKITTWTVTEIY